MTSSRWFLFLAALGTCALAGDAPPPVALSKVVPAEDLIAQVEVYRQGLREMSADEQTFADNAHKVTRDAQTLAAVALTLALYDTDHPLKTAAPALLAAAQELAAAKDFASARKALAALDKAGEGHAHAEEALKPGKVGSMGQLMKQAQFANNRIKRGLRRIADGNGEAARDSAVLAAIAQATMYDTHDIDSDQLDQWYRFCGQMRDRAGKLSATIRAADKVGAERALRELGQSCEACHAVFRRAK